MKTKTKKLVGIFLIFVIIFSIFSNFLVLSEGEKKEMNIRGKKYTVFLDEKKVTAGKTGAKFRICPEADDNKCPVKYSVGENTPFDVIGYVEGGEYKEIKLWWVTKDNYFVWVGATKEKPGEKPLTIESISLGVGETKEVDITVDLEKGLSSYEITVSISDPDIAVIETLHSPDWKPSVYHHSISPNFAKIGAKDDNNNIKGTQEKVTLATIVIKGNTSGETDMQVNITITDDNGKSYTTKRLYNVEVSESPSDQKGGGVTPLVLLKDNLKKIKQKFFQNSVGLMITFAISAVLSTVYSTILIKGAGEATPEKPLPGNEFCELCNWDNYTICTKERCEILGSCYYQPTEDEREGLCLKKDCKAGRPDVTYIKAEFLIDRTNVSSSYESKGCPNSSTKGCSLNIPYNISHKVDTVRITLNTEEPGECYYIINKKNAKIEEMTKIPYNESGNFFLKSRTFEIDISALELGKTHTIYFKCRSTCDVKHDEGFDWNYIRFTFEEKPDILPPIIVNVYPDDKRQFLSDEDKYALIEIWLDENGWCGYSDRGYYLNLTKNLSIQNECKPIENNTLMCHFNRTILPWPQCNNDKFVQNSYCKKDQQCAVKDSTGNLVFLNKSNCTRCYINISLDECFAEIINWTSLGTSLGNVEEHCKNNPENCSLILKAMEMARENGIDPTNLSGTSKLFSLNFRCWDSKNNMMKEEDTYEYRILTYPPFNMTIIKPENNSKTLEKEIYIEVNTSRPTLCKYSIDKDTHYDNMSFIDEVFDTNHTGYTPPLPAGNHTLYVRCRDAGNLERRDYVKFTIDRANLPKIIRMFGYGNDLRIETDIKAICVYSIDDTKGCNYNPLNATNFTTMDNYLHLTNLVYSWKYYVKCIDVWKDNQWPNDCTAIIIPFAIPKIE